MPSPAVTYLDSPVIDMPTFPAPRSIEFSLYTAVAVSTNPFTSQQQIQDWGTSFMEAVITMPPMQDADADDWLDFLVAARGPASVFASTAYLATRIPSTYTHTGYWRMKSIPNKWSISLGPFVGLTFEIREAK
jgi:hypothetical protein